MSSREYILQIWTGKAHRAYLPLLSSHLFKNAFYYFPDPWAISLSLQTANEMFHGEQLELLENSSL